MRRDGLFVATLGYLLLPNAIFALGWLRLAWAVPLVALIVAAVTDAARRSLTDTPPLPARQWILAGGLAGFWAIAAGIGEFNVQTWDYLKHNLVFHDLITRSWPISYGGASGGDPILCYYLAYYLPTGVLGKLLGIHWAALASFAWGLGGLLLAFAWVARLGRPRGGWVLVLFTLIDGFSWMPGLYSLAQKIGLLAGTPDREWWYTNNFAEHFFTFAGPQTRLIFQAEPAALIWVPQHTLGAWLGAACVMRSLLEKQPAHYVLLANAAAALWSPFVALGLLPFTAAACVRDLRSSLAWRSALPGAALALTVGLYFLAHGPQQFAGLLLSTFSAPTDWLKYALFLLLAVGAFWLAVGLVRRRFGVVTEPEWYALSLASLTLVAATFVYLGKYNDWAMRVSMPALFVVHLVVAAAATRLWWSGAPFRARLAFALLVLASAERSLKIYVLAPLGRVADPGIQTTIATATRYRDSLADLPHTPEFDTAAQYLGSRDTIFGRYLMKPAHPDHHQGDRR
jgi:hypothetical protein